MDSETYDAIRSMVKGDFSVPLRKRTKAINNARVRYYRNKELYSLDQEGNLKIGNRRVLRTTDINEQINHATKASKGAGARKVRLRIGNQFAGVSEKRILKKLSKSKTYQVAQARFQNRPILKPIKASCVQHRHQIDLIDMKGQVTSYPSYARRIKVSLCYVHH